MASTPVPNPSALTMVTPREFLLNRLHTRVGKELAATYRGLPVTHVFKRDAYYIVANCNDGKIRYIAEDLTEYSIIDISPLLDKMEPDRQEIHQLVDQLPVNALATIRLVLDDLVNALKALEVPDDTTVF